MHQNKLTLCSERGAGDGGAAPNAEGMPSNRHQKKIFVYIPK